MYDGKAIKVQHAQLWLWDHISAQIFIIYITIISTNDRSLPFAGQSLIRRLVLCCFGSHLIPIFEACKVVKIRAFHCFNGHIPHPYFLQDQWFPFRSQSPAMGLLLHISITLMSPFHSCSVINLLVNVLLFSFVCSLAFPFLAFGFSISVLVFYLDSLCRQLMPLFLQSNRVIVPGVDLETKSCLVKGQPGAILVGIAADKEFHIELTSYTEGRCPCNIPNFYY